MLDKKTKLFLGAFINQTNAQNINCRQLMFHLDKAYFEVYTLAIAHGNLPKLKLKGTHVFNCFFPVKLTGLMGYLWGFYHADVVYLPRADFLKWQFFLLKIFKVKSFKTIENIIDETALETALSVPNKKLKNPLDYYKYCHQNHPITAFVGRFNQEKHGLRFDWPVLPVPTDVSFFQPYYRLRTQLKEVVFIGNDFKRKGLAEFIKLASEFPQLKFHVVGKGDFHSYISGQKLDHIIYHGVVHHEGLLQILESVDLHFFPSKSEGFGKVTIECAALGIPSIVYDCYGAKEWINENEGFVVHDFDEVRKVFQDLLDHSIDFAQFSMDCTSLAERFSSQNVVPIYEKVMKELHAS